MIKTKAGIILPDGARGVIQEVMAESNVPSCTVTSTARTPREQADAMYENCFTQGVDEQYKLYAKTGDKVIAVYVSMVTSGWAGFKEKVVDAMEAKIIELGPRNVSLHCLPEDADIWVVDISPLSMIRDEQFVEAALKHPRISRVLGPRETMSKVLRKPASSLPHDPAIHLEIKKDSGTGPG